MKLFLILLAPFAALVAGQDASSYVASEFSAAGQTLTSINSAESITRASLSSQQATVKSNLATATGSQASSLSSLSSSISRASSSASVSASSARASVSSMSSAVTGFAPNAAAPTGAPLAGIIGVAGIAVLGML